MSILPIMATELEKVVERVFVDHAPIYQPQILEKELSVDSCSEEVLPYIAYNYGVPFWNDAWDEIYKRQVIKKFRHIHRIRGTLGALEDVLRSFRVNVKVKEWFEDYKFSELERREEDCVLNKPYFFEVNLYLNDNNWGVGEKAVRQIREIINWIKPILSEYKLKILFSQENVTQILSAARVYKICRMDWNYDN